MKTCFKPQQAAQMNGIILILCYYKVPSAEFTLEKWSDLAPARKKRERCWGMPAGRLPTDLLEPHYLGRLAWLHVWPSAFPDSEI